MAGSGQGRGKPNMAAEICYHVLCRDSQYLPVVLKCLPTLCQTAG